MEQIKEAIDKVGVSYSMVENAQYKNGEGTASHPVRKATPIYKQWWIYVSFASIEFIMIILLVFGKYLDQLPYVTNMNFQPAMDESIDNPVNEAYLSLDMRLVNARQGPPSPINSASLIESMLS